MTHSVGQIGVTVVGCGAVVDRLYTGSLHRLEKQGVLTVAGLVDSDFERANRLRAVFTKASVYEDVVDAIHETGSNLTIVATPAVLHAEHSVSALQNGSHVLCEKPMAVTTAQCDQMIDAASNSGLRLAIGMTRRFFPSLATLQQVIARDDLGQILSVSHREGGEYNWAVTTSASFQRREDGGGVLLDAGSHALDTLIWFFGLPLIVSCFDDALEGVEANCKIQFELAGWQGTIHLSWDHAMTNELRIVGTNGEAVVSLGSIDKLFIKRGAGFDQIAPEIVFPTTAIRSDTSVGTPRTYAECIYFQLIQVIRAIVHNEPVPVSGEQGKEVISLIEACYRIAQPMDMTWLPPAQNAAHKRLHRRNKQ